MKPVSAHSLRYAWTAALAALVASPSWACPVCFSASPRVRAAFFGTTVLLSVLPLGMIGAGVAWLRKGGAWRGEFEEREGP